MEFVEVNLPAPACETAIIPIGTHGPYAACAIMTKDNELKEAEVGSFDPEAADGASAKLRHDFRTIETNVQRTGSPASLLRARDIFGG